MANLHNALKALGPVDFSDVPKTMEELDVYLKDILAQSELIIESIPIPPPTGKEDGKSYVASNASEVTLSAARSEEATTEPAALQKEWGKPLKINAKENSLSMSVYKLSGKDGKGAWFARRSVHEGIGFSRFKKSLEDEFEQSMAVDGPAGAGNVRGIGGETRVERIEVKGRGTIEVYRLSAQFPGPTTPRDFVTMLVTSETAMTSSDKSDKNTPKHYMIVSKPCNHPDTQPMDGFVRGSYESVEFIREVPRTLNGSMSTASLPAPLVDGSKNDSSSQSDSNLAHTTNEAEGNPVEWIMITRSDPGGSVPRFMVERGTPGSICSDATKFLNWACQRVPDTKATPSETPAARPSTLTEHRESYQSWRGSRVAGVEPDASDGSDTTPPAQSEKEILVYPAGTEQNGDGGGFLGSVATSLTAFTPQVVLDHLPGSNATTSTEASEAQPVSKDLNSSNLEKNSSDETASIETTTSFASAEDHLTSDSDVPTESSKILTEKPSHISQHDKDLQKLEERRAQMNTKFAESRSKLDAQTSELSAKEEAAHKKAMEKHEKEVQKQEEKYQKELKKLEQKQEKERQKLEQKRRKQADKDDKTRLTRERDEARAEHDLAKQEVDVLRKAVEDLQKENAALAAKVAQIDLVEQRNSIEKVVS